jgi:hypothetical protein
VKIVFMAEEIDDRQKEADQKLNEILQKFRQKSEDLHQKSYEIFDKQLVYFSTGALGLSFVLIDKVVRDVNQSHHKWMLITGWVLLILTLLLNLVSHVVAAYIHRQTVRLIDEGLFDSPTSGKMDKKNRVLDFFNYLFYAIMVIGIIFIFLYASLNMLNMGNNNNKLNESITNVIPKVNTSTIEKSITNIVPIIPSAPKPAVTNTTTSAPKGKQ